MYMPTTQQNVLYEQEQKSRGFFETSPDEIFEISPLKITSTENRPLQMFSFNENQKRL